MVRHGGRFGRGTLRSRRFLGSFQRREGALVVPWHPVRRRCGHRLAVPQEGDEIRENENIIELGGMDHRHPHIADLSAGLGFEKERILAMEDRDFQAPLDGIMPTPGLCRFKVTCGRPFGRMPAFCHPSWRHNQRASRKASKGSGGLYLVGMRPLSLACASARSFSRMSACK